jgi:anti-sigma regulatory factor (Ser/Thr protein kinase)
VHEPATAPRARPGDGAETWVEPGSFVDERSEGDSVPQHDLIGSSNLTLHIPASVDAPGIARRKLAASIGSQLDDERLNDVRLLVSELVTNAVRHAGLSESDEITVHIRADGRGFILEISDTGRGFYPMPRSEAAVAGGWGLPLLQHLSDGWGVEHRPEGGSMVWFRIDRRD